MSRRALDFDVDVAALLPTGLTLENRAIAAGQYRLLQGESL